MKTGWRSIFAVIIAGSLLLISGVPSDAARQVARGSSYDGTWSVAIYTLRGDCGSLRAALRIIGGRVSSGDGSYQAYGAVGAGGAIRVTLIRGSQSASGSGRLSSNSGGGRWRTSGGECFGSWSAAASSLLTIFVLRDVGYLVRQSGYGRASCDISPKASLRFN